MWIDGVLGDTRYAYINLYIILFVSTAITHLQHILNTPLATGMQHAMAKSSAHGLGLDDSWEWLEEALLELTRLQQKGCSTIREYEIMQARIQYMKRVLSYTRKQIAKLEARLPTKEGRP